jgi:CRISPR system Cascade subunit CasC
MKITVDILTPMAPANPNRDELGRPKTAIYGGYPRMRMSSQSVKRAIRLSEPFKVLEDKISVRSREIPVRFRDDLVAAGIKDKDAVKYAEAVAGVFGKVNKKDPPATTETVVYGVEEIAAINALKDKLISEKRAPTEDELDALQKNSRCAVDVALFGRMRASTPSLNVEAACSVSHSITVNTAKVEADFWTAVDDLSGHGSDDDMGAAGMGEIEFGSGVFYQHLSLDLGHLVSNLDDDFDLAGETATALVEAVVNSYPTGHRSTFGNNALAEYVALGICTGNPVNLISAFEQPVKPGQQRLTEGAIAALEEQVEKLSRAYGPLWSKNVVLDVPGQRGSMDELRQFVQAAIEAYKATS